MSKPRSSQERNDKTSAAHPRSRETQQNASQAGQQSSQAVARQRGQAREGLERGGPESARRERFGLTPWGYASPFSFMRRFSEDMDRLFGELGFQGGGFGQGPGMPAGRGMASRGMWSPQIEMFEREGKLVVRADLPGMSKDDIKVDLEDDAITIQGERRSEHEENREGFYRTERSYGSFYRTIPLPDGVNGEDAKATFRDGVLEVVMDAPKPSRGRRIDIEEGTA